MTTTDTPHGYYTWVAMLRDGREIHETFDGQDLISIDALKGLDVAALHLVPYRGERSYVRLDIQPGQRPVKVWTHTIRFNIDGGEQTEGPVVDKFGIEEADGTVHVWHHCFPDGSILVSTSGDF